MSARLSGAPDSGEILSTNKGGGYGRGHGTSHAAAHVTAELAAYHDLVAVGCYLIVEDTNVNGHPVRPDFGAGPMEAIDLFLTGRDDFVSDRDRERFLLTMNPRGFLRRVR